METRQLAKESQQRLNGFMDQLRGSVAVDLSAKNLGEEGTQYVSEALAFNDRCTTLTICPGAQLSLLLLLCIATFNRGYLHAVELTSLASMYHAALATQRAQH